MPIPFPPAIHAELLEVSNPNRALITLPTMLSRIPSMNEAPKRRQNPAGSPTGEYRVRDGRREHAARQGDGRADPAAGVGGGRAGSADDTRGGGAADAHPRTGSREP